MIPGLGGGERGWEERMGKRSTGQRWQDGQDGTVLINGVSGRN